jgi:hypothetical protein
MEVALKSVPALYTPKKLDIGAGINPGPVLRDKKGAYITDANGKPKREPGWTGIDIEPNSDIVWDLWQYPWPIASGSVSKVHMAHFVEHIPHWRPGWDKDGWWMFWEEVYRITRKGATVDVTHPFLKHDRSFWDPTHERFIPGETWAYLDRNWREANDLGHYTDCDFESTVFYAGLEPDLMGRNDEFTRFHVSHSWNAVPDLNVKLKRR